MDQLTVEQLIERLSNVEDKTRPVFFLDEDLKRYSAVESVDDDDGEGGEVLLRGADPTEPAPRSNRIGG